MISVILYGRNDSHGYNLHKRAAISFNCLAEALSDPADEIIFVDYNTPDELPTFVEAIYDTLTLRAKSLLRVLRVRPELHKRMVPPTHLAAVEPHSRNIALRRSNPRNRWVLLTNTDMVFVPREGFADLSHAVTDLPDGHYTLPRFELPEPLWESFPRTDPAEIFRLCRDLGPRLHLEEVTLSFPFSRYDQVGDFQLAPRQSLFQINGFDERMIHGWHCDSNIARRLYLFFGERSESLHDRLKGYHCDHTRVATGAHRLDMKVDNNVQEFVFAVDDPVAHHQAETWGVPGEPIEELSFTHDPAARFAAAVEAAVGAPQQTEYVADAIGLRNFVWYRPEHVLAYLASDLAVYPRQARFAYAGNHPRMLELAARCIREMGFQHPLAYAAGLLQSGPAPAEAARIAAAPGDLPEILLRDYHLLIFDFGVQDAAINPANVERVTDWPRNLRYSLGAVARVLEATAEKAGAAEGRTPDFLAINANHHTFRNFVGQFLMLADTPYATHVRKGRARRGEERLYRSNNWKYTEDGLRSFFGYDVTDISVPGVAVDERVDFTSAGHPAGYKDGHWGATDYTGTWTDGSRAAFLFRPPTSLAGDLLVNVRVNEVFIGPEDDPMHVEVLLDGVRQAHWSFFTRYEIVDAKLVIPAAQLAGKQTCRLEFHVENPQSAARAARAQGQTVIGDDPRMLGIKVQRIDFATTDRLRYQPGETLEFLTRGSGGAHTNECWSIPDDLGVWSFGPRATLLLHPARALDSRAQAIFAINDVSVNDAHPTQGIRVLYNGQPIAAWTLGPARDAGERRVLLPPDALRTTHPATIAFEIEQPRTPVGLGWSTWDKRPLGFRMSRFRIAPVGRLQYRLGDAIDFVDTGDSLVFVGDAMGVEWSLPGPRGSWTLGNTATFRVPLEQDFTGDLPAAFLISGCVVSPKAPTLRVAVKVNGARVAEWILSDRKLHCRALKIPAFSGRQLDVTFEIADPRSPESLGWSSDTRPLGFQLARVVIGKDQAAPPKFQFTGSERPMYQRILGLPQFSLHVARILWRRFRQWRGLA